MVKRINKIKKLIEGQLQIGLTPNRESLLKSVTNTDLKILITFETGSRQYPYLNPITLSEQVGDIMQLDVLDWTMECIGQGKWDLYKMVITLG